MSCLGELDRVHLWMLWEVRKYLNPVGRTDSLGSFGSSVFGSHTWAIKICCWPQLVDQNLIISLLLWLKREQHHCCFPTSQKFATPTKTDFRIHNCKCWGIQPSCKYPWKEECKYCEDDEIGKYPVRNLNALKAFYSPDVCWVWSLQWRLQGVVQDTGEILLKPNRMGGENVTINNFNKLNWFNHSTAALQLPRELRFLA